MVDQCPVQKTPVVWGPVYEEDLTPLGPLRAGWGVRGGPRVEDGNTAESSFLKRKNFLESVLDSGSILQYMGS